MKYRLKHFNHIGMLKGFDVYKKEGTLLLKRKKKKIATAFMKKSHFERKQ